MADLNYQIKFNSNLDDLLKQIKAASDALKSMASTSRTSSSIDASFSKIEKAIGRITEKASQPIGSKSVLGGLVKDARTVENELSKLFEKLQKIQSFEPDTKAQIMSVSGLKSFTDAVDAAEAFWGALEDVSKNAKIAESRVEGYSDAVKKLGKVEKKVADDQALVSELKAKKKALEDFIETVKIYNSQKADKGKNLTVDGKTYRYQAARKAVREAMPNLVGSFTSDDNMNTIAAELEKLKGGGKDSIAKAEGQLRIDQAQLATAQKTLGPLAQKVEEINKNLRNEAWTAYCNAVKKAGVSLEGINVEGGYTEEAFAQIGARVTELGEQLAGKFDGQAQKLSEDLGNIGNTVHQLGEETQYAADKGEALDKQMSDVSAITNRAKQYVGLVGGINILQKAISKASSSIKELDKIMTEMAVVTDLGIGDYWDQLTEYTARANKLGVAIGDVYEADTLLYQQGAF